MRLPMLVFLFLLCVLAPAQDPARPKDKREDIQDNSFLIEEAYNQEPGVVQHISTWQRFRETRDWGYSFTQEWPVGGQAHQFSYTLPLLRVSSLESPRTGLGDVLLNYRYQLLGDGDAPVAISPRISLVLPTGDREKGLGTSAAGVQFNLPVSVVLAPELVTHWNAGYTYLPRARNAEGDRADLAALNLGGSLIWLVHENFNLMLEAVHTRAEAITGPGTKAWAGSSFLSPGLRWAHNLPSGLQIVPGIAFPIGVGSSARERAVFLYLSFEHPFGRKR